MGLSIHYRGTFNRTASLSEMIEEIKDISETHHWNYLVFERQFPKNSLGKKDFNKNVYGILFTPPHCEPVKLCFLSNGRMGNPFMLEYWLKSKSESDKKLIFGNSTKTQYAGIEIHKIIINLLRYISKKYFRTFSLIDEGQYWETGDEELLKKIFRDYDGLISRFTHDLENGKLANGESLEEYILRIAKKIHSGRKKK